VNGTTVLLVDDDEALVDALGGALRLEGFDVEVASDYDQALSAFDRVGPDIVLLDLMLPGPSGFEVCRDIRSRSSVPILMISGRGGEGDIVSALGAGADDYLVKPFGVHELIARMRAALRRSPRRERSEDDKIIQAGDVNMQPASGRAWVGSKPLELSSGEFDLLAVLVRHADKVLTRAELVKQAGGLDGLSKKTVDARMRRLRAKLPPHMRIVTIRGVGFRYESDVPGKGTTRSSP
jgi:two-component system response regulator RegX3